MELKTNDKEAEKMPFYCLWVRKNKFQRTSGGIITFVMRSKQWLALQECSSYVIRWQEVKGGFIWWIQFLGKVRSNMLTVTRIFWSQRVGEWQNICNGLGGERELSRTENYQRLPCCSEDATVGDHRVAEAEVCLLSDFYFQPEFG